jgi:hypothetical protein
MVGEGSAGLAGFERRTQIANLTGAGLPVNQECLDTDARIVPLGNFQDPLRPQIDRKDVVDLPS